jgi:polysaccharide transporter, PST family
LNQSYFGATAPSADLHRRSLRGGATAMIAQGGNVVVQTVSTIVLARILLPEDFGLVAMVSAVTGYAAIFIDLGTRDAVAQRSTVTEGEASALFWITFALGLTLTAITLVSAPLFAHFYGEPRLKYVAMVMSITFAVPALYFQQYALMRRALMFRKLATIDVSSSVLATALAIFLAYRNYGYWALVWKPVLTTVFTGLGVWITCGWWPKRPTFNAGTKELLGFGLNVTGFTVADSIARSADRVALGYTTGPKELGYYQNAFNVYDNAINVCTTLHNVATATLTKLRGDLPALRRAWSTALAALAYFTAPAFTVLAVVGQDLVSLVLGSKWKTAGAILTILALRGPAHVVERTHGWLHVAAGRPERWRHWGILNCVLTLGALFCGLPFGAFGVAAAYAILTYLLFIPAIIYAGKPLGIGVGDVLRTVGPQIITAFGVAAVGFGLRFWVMQDTPPLVRLLTLGILCSALYLAIMTFGFRVTKPLTIAASLVRGRKSGIV